MHLISPIFTYVLFRKEDILSYNLAQNTWLQNDSEYDMP